MAADMANHNDEERQGNCRKKKQKPLATEWRELTGTATNQRIVARK